MAVAGRWRIVETDLWDQGAVELLGPGLIEFGDDQMGSVSFIAVQADIDYRHVNRLGRPATEFTFDGNDGHPINGRGWAAIEEDGSLVGRIYFHLGDESGFRATQEG